MSCTRRVADPSTYRYLLNFHGCSRGEHVLHTFMYLARYIPVSDIPFMFFLLSKKKYICNTV